MPNDTEKRDEWDAAKGENAVMTNASLLRTRWTSPSKTIGSSRIFEKGHGRGTGGTGMAVTKDTYLHTVADSIREGGKDTAGVIVFEGHEMARRHFQGKIE